MILSIVTFLFLILLSGSFSGSESAIFSLGQSRLSRLRESRSKKVKRLIELMKDPEKTLMAILLANLAINIMISSTGDHIIASILPPGVNADIVALVSITLVLLFFAEIFPKILAMRKAESWSLLAAPFLQFWSMLATPLAHPVRLLSGLITRLFPAPSETHIKEKDLIEAVRTAQTSGHLRSEEQDILNRAIYFYYDNAYSIMLPKSRCVMIPHNISSSEAGKIFRKHKTPISVVYHKSTGKIEGYLHVRSLVPLLLSKQKTVKNKIQNMLFLPETISLKDLLREFIEQKAEVAAIVDELGEFSGIVTMKDIFQTLMGDVDEEYRKHLVPEQEKLSRIKKETWLINGEITINDFNEYFHTNLHSEHSETLSGFIIEKIDGFPKEGTILEYHGLKFYKMEVKENKIAQTKLYYSPKSEEKK